MAVRMASSLCRPSARTRKRFATLAHAMRSTIPTVASSTQSTLPTSPTASCFRGRTFGPSLASSIILAVNPGGSGNFFRVSGIMRATSAFAWSKVIPGLSRAIA